MNTITFSEMLKLLRSGKTVSIDYITYSETRNSGGRKRSITCRNHLRESLKKKNRIKRKNPYKEDIIIMDLELVAGDLPTNEYRKVYPLFITHINNRLVTIG